MQTPRNDYSAVAGQSAFSRLNSHSRTSFISPTPSVEADDELSSLDDYSIYADPYTLEACTMPKYEGEDTRLTSKKELAGWYSYGWAAEVFAICAMGSFLPITLEQLARDRGVLFSDKTTPCTASWVSPPGNSTSSVLPGPQPKHPHNELPACIITILGAEINTASFAMYTFSASVLIQALLIISMSGAADHGKFRKTFLLAFAFVGATAMMLFLAVLPNLYLLGALLAIIANTCFGASFVLLNSFLPLLVRHHPSIQPADWNESAYHDSVENDFTSAEILSEGEDPEDDRGLLSSSSQLLPEEVPDHTAPLRSVPAAISPELMISTRISSNGIGIGYLAGLFVQCVAIGIIVATGSTTFSLRLVLFVVGLWWFAFSVPAALWLRPRPGPPLPSSKSQKQNWVGYFTYAWLSLYKTIKQARRLKDIVIFLAAWFLLSDSIATVSGTAVLFAKTQLAMKTEALGLINVIATIAGVIGAFYWSFFSRMLNLRASQTIVACICLFEIIPLYGLLGFIPAVKRLGVFGLQQPWEMYPLGAIYGFVLGGLSSYCRSFFGELIPPGFEAAFYALYAITDKGSSIFGPAIVGAITDRYGEIRPAFVFLAVLIALPLPLMMMVDVDRGKAEAKAMALELEGKRRGDVIGEYSAVPTVHLPEEHDDL